MCMDGSDHGAWREEEKAAAEGPGWQRAGAWSWDVLLLLLPLEGWEAVGGPEQGGVGGRA